MLVLTSIKRELHILRNERIPFLELDDKINVTLISACLKFVANKQTNLLLGGQFSNAVRFVESEVDHGLKQRYRLLGVSRLTQEMTLLAEDVWTDRYKQAK